jgi:hypothetical protein
MPSRSLNLNPKGTIRPEALALGYQSDVRFPETALRKTDFLLESRHSGENRVAEDCSEVCMKKITSPVHLSSRAVRLIKCVIGYLSEIIHCLSRGSFGIDLASTENRHFVLPPPSEGPLALLTGQKQDQGLFAFSRFPILWLDKDLQCRRSLLCTPHAK